MLRPFIVQNRKYLRYLRGLNWYHDLPAWVEVVCKGKQIVELWRNDLGWDPRREKDK